MSTTEAKTVEQTAQDLLDAVIWMSGSRDFGPEGEAHEGWVRVREEVVNPALKLLAKGDPA